MATIRKRGNTYQIRVSGGIGSDGKQIVHTTSWTPPKGLSTKGAEQEAQRQATLFEERIRTGMAPNGKIKLADFAEMWMEKHARRTLRPKTVHRYEGLLKRIVGELGHIQIDQLHPLVISSFYDSLAQTTTEKTLYICKADLKELMREEGLTQVKVQEMSGVSETTIRKMWNKQAVSHESVVRICAALDLAESDCFAPDSDVKVLSPTTILHYHRLLSDILQYAVIWQYIPFNPCDRLAPPKAGTDNTVFCLDENQARMLVKLLQEEPAVYRQAILLLLYTGMRRGELMGLEWQDINFSDRSITIQRTSQYLPGPGVFTDKTKNKSSQRIIKIPANAINALKEQQAWQLRCRETNKDAWVDSGRVITTERGAPMNPNRLTHWFSKFIERSELPDICLHTLRHTYASLCILAGAPITGVSAQLGHSSVATTTRIYAHSIQTAQVKTADAISSVLDSI